MSEANKVIVRRFYEEVMNQGNVNVLDEIMAPDFNDHGETLFGSPQGRDTLKQGISASRRCSAISTCNCMMSSPTGRWSVCAAPCGAASRSFSGCRSQRQ